jgi:transcriptional regulator GlxA family with amidase domain
MKTKRIVHVAYEKFQLLDIAGAAAVFSTANNLLNKAIYELITVSSEGGVIQTMCGTRILTTPLCETRPGAHDTVLIPGAERAALLIAVGDRTLQEWLLKAEKRVERMSSVCSGAFLLAACGMLNHRCATTHWAASEELTQFFPDILVKSDALYIADGKIWTAAGATACIDLALSMLRADHGEALAHDVAKRLVVYSHRPGGQSQFSVLLATQRDAGNQLRDLIAWIDEHLDRDLSMVVLANRANVSERTLHRRFCAALGVAPATYVDSARLERARQMLEEGFDVKIVAQKIGYKSELGLRKAYLKRFGVSPAFHRRLHRP